MIDVGGRDTGSLRAALTVTNTLLIPVQPRSFDIWAVDQVADLVNEAREINGDLRAVVIINAADAQGRDNEDALAILKEIGGIETLSFTVGRRKAFADAAATGRAVIEQVPRNLKAVQELTDLVDALYNVVR